MDDRKKRLASLRIIGNDVVAAQPETQAVLDQAVEDALLFSFEQRPMRVMTKAAVEERFSMIEKIVKIARFDCKNSIYRIAAHLKRWLIAELDGGDWQPEAKKSLYAPDTMRKQTRSLLVGADGAPLN